MAMLEKAKVTDLAQLAHIAEEEFMEVGCKLIHARRVIELANRVVYRSLSDTKELARTQELAVAGGAWDDGAYPNHHQVHELEPLPEDADGSFSPRLADTNAKFDAAVAANSVRPANANPNVVERIGTKASKVVQ